MLLGGVKIAVTTIEIVPPVDIVFIASTFNLFTYKYLAHMFRLIFLCSVSNSCALSQRFISKFEKLADALNSRDDLKLAHVNCDDEPKLCESKGGKGNFDGETQPNCLQSV